ncbi:hypothetical protein OAU44_00405 [bacterium]|nr:hypothetical protein [bacterium]|tara:strand:+ start:1884 stop:2168 length:285 start_codon:yes stop_codon:yes gene_type:complete
MIRPRRILARVAGNFGISFFSPLISGNLAEQIFEMGISFEDTLIIAGLSSIFVTGYTMSKELRDWGRERKVTSNEYDDDFELDQWGIKDVKAGE